MFGGAQQSTVKSRFRASFQGVKPINKPPCPLLSCSTLMDWATNRSPSGVVFFILSFFIACLVFGYYIFVFVFSG